MANNDNQPSNNMKQSLTRASNTEVANCICDEYGVKYSSDGKKLIKAPKNLQEYIIKPGTEIICSDAFNNCEQLTSIEIPDTVTQIGFEAFFNCSSLTNIDFPNSLTNIDHNAFQRCINLKSVTLSSPSISIGIWAFKECRNLKSVTFRYPLDYHLYEKIKIEIGAMAFVRCPIKSLVIPLNKEEDYE